MEMITIAVVLSMVSILACMWWRSKSKKASHSQYCEEKIEVVILGEDPPSCHDLIKAAPEVIGVGKDIGKRPRMEDSDLVANLGSFDGMLVGVFDGHGGAFTSNFVAERFAKFFAQERGCPVEALKKSFHRCEEAVWDAFDGGDSSGTTALVALVQEDTIHVGNVGDCRAVLCEKGRAKQITCDHKAGSEKERVEAAGGFIDGEGYLCGEIGVSRALGDCHLEASKIKMRDGSGPLIALPEIHSTERTANAEFLLIASDGVLDVVSTHRAVDIMRKLLVTNATPTDAANELVQEALRMGTVDNVTALVVALQSLPLPPKQIPPRNYRNSRLRLAPRSEVAESGPVQCPDNNSDPGQSVFV